MRSATLLVLALAAAVLPATAGAQVEITQQLYDHKTGGPVVVANYRPDGQLATPQWRVCTGACSGVIATGAIFEAPAPAAGAMFEATTTFGGETTTARTARWTGPLTNTAAPRVTGIPAVGQELTLVPGTWTGGWETGDVSRVGFMVCPAAAGGNACRSVNPNLSTSDRWTVPAIYAGWWIGAAEIRDGAGTLHSGVTKVVPTDQPSPWPAPLPDATTVRSQLIGPVPKIGDGAIPPTPKVKFRKRLQRVGERLKLGTVRCPNRCTVDVEIWHGMNSTYQFTLRRIKRDETVDLTVESALLRGKKGALRVYVSVDGGTEHRGTVKRR